MNPSEKPLDRLLKLKEVEEMIGFKKDFIYLHIKKQQFPKPITFDRASRWKLSDIQRWINELSSET